MAKRDQAGQNDSVEELRPDLAAPEQQASSLPASGAASASGGGAVSEHRPHLGPDLQSLIGKQLRAVYHEVLSEPVPDRFVRLLEELAAKQADGR